VLKNEFFITLLIIYPGIMMNKIEETG